MMNRIASRPSTPVAGATQPTIAASEIIILDLGHRTETNSHVPRPGAMAAVKRPPRRASLARTATAWRVQSNPVERSTGDRPVRCAGR